MYASIFSFFRRLASFIAQKRHESLAAKKWITRTNWARKQLPLLKNATRMRFSDEVLVVLLRSGWFEGRVEGLPSSEGIEKADLLCPAAQTILREFGGLILEQHHCRMLRVAPSDDDRKSRRLQILEGCVGSQLWQIGNTNIFEDDGLDIFVDRQGRTFLDGLSDADEGLIEYLADDFDRALNVAFGHGQRDLWRDSGAPGRWNYHVGTL